MNLINLRLGDWIPLIKNKFRGVNIVEPTAMVLNADQMTQLYWSERHLLATQPLLWLTPQKTISNACVEWC